MGNVTRNDKLIKLRETQLFISQVSHVIHLVTSGESESAACRKVGIDLSKFRNFISKDYYNRAAKSEELKDGIVAWQDRLVADILGVKNAEVLPDFPKVYKAMLSRLSNRQLKVVKLYYENDYTLEQCGKVLGVQRERVRQILCQSIRRMRYYQKYLIYGYDKYNELNRINENIKEIEEEIENKNRELLDKLSELDKTDSRYKTVTSIIKSVIGDEELISIDYNKKQTPMSELDLSVRSYNCLARAGVNTVEDILNLNYRQLLRIRNLGKRSVDEIVSKMHELGFKDFPSYEN